MSRKFRPILFNMTPLDIAALQKRIGVEPDGFWGPVSTAAAQKHLRAMMPVPARWPKTDQTSLSETYGGAGDEAMLVSFPCPVPMQYEKQPVKTLRCHHKVKDSLIRVLRAIYADGKYQWVLDQYAGIYNNRTMRGGSTPSLHARGAAIDLDPEYNGNHAHWPTQARMPIEVMEYFAREGWMPAGAFWSRDAMHFQATQ